MIRRLVTFLAGTLRGRLIVGVAVVHAVMMALFIADLTVRQRAMLLDRQAEEATALSHALATSAAGWLAARDISGLQEIAEAQRQYPEVLFAILADNEGRVLACTDPSRRGLYLQDLPASVGQQALVRTPALVDVTTPAILEGRHVGWARVGIGQKTASEKLATITRSGVLYALAAILTGSLIAWFMGRRISQRLYAVQKTIGAVRAGDRQARSAIAGSDEAAAMAREFNEMLDAMAAAEQRVALMNFALDNVHEAAFLIDATARFRYVNKEACRILGYSRQELLALGVTDVDPDFPPERWPAHWQELQTRGSLTFESRHRTSNGQALPVEINANYFQYDGHGYNLALVRDISERKKAEEERLTHLRFLKSMDQINRALQGTTDLEQMLGAVLDAALAIFGCDRAFLLHPCDPEAAAWQVPMERTRPEYPGAAALATRIPMDDEVAATLRLLLAAEGPVTFGPGAEQPLPARVTERFGIRSFIAMAIHPKVGQPWQFGLHQCSRPRLWSDEEKRLFHEIGLRLTGALTTTLAYRDLRTSQSNLAEAQRIARLGSWELDLATNHLSWSDEVFRIFEIAPDRFGASYEAFLDAIHPEDRERVNRAYTESMANHAPYASEHRLLFPDGRIKHLQEHCETSYDAGGRPLRSLGTVQDITELRQAEEALRRSEELTRTILETVDEGFFIVDPEYRILSANRAYCQMTGFTVEEAVGRHCYEISHRADRPCFETGWECPVRETLATGGSRGGITHVHLGENGTPRHVELKSFPITDADGRVVAVIETLNNVTEKRKLEEQLLQAQKMEAVGRLAGGVAHDFNNMVGVIIGHTEMALRQLETGHPLLASLQEIRKAAGRSADLTRQLLAFARKQAVAPKVLDLNATLEGMLKILRRLIGEDIDLVWLPGKGLWPLRIDPSQIDQILANLSVNARDAISGVGKVTIETANAVIDETYCAGHPEAAAGDYVMLAVSDNGCGMDHETIGRIFEPFFTTKELGKGTGLGLATVYGIVKQNNGFINVYSEPGQGTTFKIYLPRHHEAGLEAEGGEGVTLPLTGGRETLLLAEDEAAILEMVREVLESLGYRVLTAATPGEALRLAREHGEKIDLLMSDVIMPEMNGRELARELVALHPEMKCLFMSGYTADVIVHHGVLEEGVHFIQKPFSIHDLAAKIREVLDGEVG